MSAYIVEPETIDRIITWAETSLRKEWEYGYRRLYAIAEAKTPDELGRALLRMNTDAVNERYGENNVPPKYWYKPLPATPVQVLKSMQCLRYQCTEGAVTESKLYTFLDKLTGWWAEVIVENLDEYQQAVWG